MAKFTIFTRPRFCPQAHSTGSDKSSVSVGDLILFESPMAEGGTRKCLARVLGLANDLPDRSDPGKDTLIVLQVDDMLSFAYERYVKLGDVLRIRSTEKNSVFAQWFLMGPVPKPEVAIAAVKYGCVNDRYIDKHLQHGELKASFRDVDKVAE